MKEHMSTVTLDERVGKEKLDRASEILRAAAHPQRLAILDALGTLGRLCNTQLQDLLGIEQAILSQHLALMRDKGLVICEKEGKFTYWQLRQPEFLKIVHCLENCCHTL